MHERSIDAVIDLVGGEVQARSFAVLRPGGILVSAVSKPDQEVATRHGVRALFFLVNVTTAHLTQIAAMINAGDLAVNVGTVLPPFVADIAPAGGRVTAAGDDLAVEPGGIEICVDQVPQLMIAPAHVDGLTATGKSMHGDDEIAHRDQSEAFGLVELRRSYVKVGVGP